jgi:hypothetical protein
MQEDWLSGWHANRLTNLWKKKMKRRNFLFSTIASSLLPKSIWASDKANAKLVIKNGWILKIEDL